MMPSAAAGSSPLLCDANKNMNTKHQVRGPGGLVPPIDARGARQVGGHLPARRHLYQPHNGEGARARVPSSVRSTATGAPPEPPRVESTPQHGGLMGFSCPNLS